MRSVDGSLTPDEIESTMKNTARAHSRAHAASVVPVSQMPTAAIAAIAGGPPPPPPPPPPPGPTELTNGVAETGRRGDNGRDDHVHARSAGERDQPVVSRSAAAAVMRTCTSASVPSRRRAPTTAGRTSNGNNVDLQHLQRAGRHVLRDGPPPIRRSRVFHWLAALTNRPAAPAARSNRTTCRHPAATGCATRSRYRRACRT